VVRDLSCLWCAGYQDGYRVGANGIDAAGNPTAGYDEALFGHDGYRDGLATGRAGRIDDDLAVLDLAALDLDLPDLPV
jgi:hypothetical protein